LFAKGCLLKDKKGEGAQELARSGSNRNEQQVDDALRYIQLHLPKNQKGNSYKNMTRLL